MKRGPVARAPLPADRARETYPVTGGVKAAITPILGAVQPLYAAGSMVTIPGFVGWIATVTLPAAFVRPESLRIPGPLISTLTPEIALFLAVTCSWRLPLLPTVRLFGATTTA